MNEDAIIMMPQWLPLLPHPAVTVPPSELEPDTKDALSLCQIPGSKGFNRITQIGPICEKGLTLIKILASRIVCGWCQ